MNERALHGLEQLRFRESLLEKVDGSHPHRAKSRGNLGVAGHDDDRRTQRQFRELLLQGQTARPLHADVEDQAPGTVGIELFEVGVGRSKRLGSGAHGRAERGERCGERGIGVAYLTDALLPVEMREEVIMLHPVENWRLMWYRKDAGGDPRCDAVEAFLLSSVLQDPDYRTI